MITHHHTRSDFPQHYSPLIPSPRPHHPLTKCSPQLERCVRELLTWHAGSCGLIADDAKDRIARMFLDGVLTLTDLRKLASRKVYQECVMWIDEIVSMRKGKT